MVKEEQKVFIKGRNEQLFEGTVIKVMGNQALLKMKCPEWNIGNPGMSCSRFVNVEDIKGEQIQW